MSEPVARSIVLPDNAAALARQSLAIAPDGPLRIAFVAGPGDVVGTFEHWVEGRHDPRTPVIAYSSMFYSVVDSLQAEALVLEEAGRQPDSARPGFTFQYTPRRRDRGGIGYRLDQRAFTADVLRRLRDFRPHVVLAGIDAPPALLARLPKSARLVLTVHNTFWPMGRRPEGLKARVKIWLAARPLPRFDSAVCTSQECADQLAALGGPVRTSLVEVPQMLADFLPDTPVTRTQARRILFLGRIEEAKGIFDLLAAFEAVADDRPDLSLTFAGAGMAEAALRERIGQSRHADRITFPGQFSAREVHETLEKTDLLVCPTRTSFPEGLALVVVEAAAHGVPTLLSSIIPAKALVPGACVEFPADDTAALTAELRRLVERPDDYGALAKQLASQRDHFLDRSKSWGTLFYRAILAQTRP